MLIDLSELNDVQKEAVKAGDGPLLILAGAGSGKTRVLTYRIAYLMSQGVEPKNILAITFTNKAANEMKQRIHGLVGENVKDIWSGTFHNICVRILKMYGDRIGVDKSFGIFDDSDSEKLLKAIIKDRFNDTLEPKVVAAVISNMKVNLATPTMARELVNSDIDKQIVDVYERYEDLLKVNNALDFDDLIMKAVHLLQRDAQTRIIFQNKFKYILVDEYQDVNKSQYEFVKLLANKNRNIFVVGMLKR